MDTLKTLLDERYATQTKALEAAFVAADKAVVAALASQQLAATKAETAAEKRFESVNEFRQQLADQSSTFIARPEYLANYNAMGNRVSALETRSNQSTGRTEGVQYILGLGVSILLILAAFIGYSVH
jgi:hypothetical protein